MESSYDFPMNQVLETYRNTPTPTLTEQLLYAILAQLNKINYQLDRETNHEG